MYIGMAVWAALVRYMAVYAMLKWSLSNVFFSVSLQETCSESKGHSILVSSCAYHVVAENPSCGHGRFMIARVQAITFYKVGIVTWKFISFVTCTEGYTSIFNLY